MSQIPAPSPAATVFIQQPSPRPNGFGIAGFILSLTGLLGGIVCIGTLLSPFGLLLSLVGLRREPRGLAITGSIMGLLGTLWLALWALLVAGVVFLAGQGIEFGGGFIQDVRSADGLYQEVDTFISTKGRVPTQAEVNEFGYTDASGHPFRIRPRGKGYAIFNSGFDGIAGNRDDIEMPRGGFEGHGCGDCDP